MLTKYLWGESFAEISALPKVAAHALCGASRVCKGKSNEHRSMRAVRAVQEYGTLKYSMREARRAHFQIAAGIGTGISSENLRSLTEHNQPCAVESTTCCKVEGLQICSKSAEAHAACASKW